MPGGRHTHTHTHRHTGTHAHEGGLQRSVLVLLGAWGRHTHTHTHTHAHEGGLQRSVLVLLGAWGTAGTGQAPPSFPVLSQDTLQPRKHFGVIIG